MVISSLTAARDGSPVMTFPFCGVRCAPMLQVTPDICNYSKYAWRSGENLSAFFTSGPSVLNTNLAPAASV
ncbi:MAG: hypothetical protein H0U38_03080 [Chloroflexia bacterium]|nr:hypothetical protein [Chloroflexia bacterium]